MWPNMYQSILRKRQKNGMIHPNSKYMKQRNQGINKEENQDLQILNAQLLSAIYNDSQMRKEEQSRFMNIITQLHEIVQTLKEQKEVKNTKKYSKTKEIQRNKDEPEYLNETHPVISEWEQGQAFESLQNTYSNQSLSNSIQSSISGCSSKKMDGTPYKSVKHKTNKKVTRNKLKHFYSKLHKHERFISKTKFLYKELQEQGKTLVSMVDGLKNEQQKEKNLTECLLQKVEELANADNWVQLQALAFNHLESRISKVEQSLTENKSNCIDHQEEINKLTQELDETNKLKEDISEKNLQIKKELSILTDMLTKERLKVDELTKTIEKEMALNDSLKQNFDAQLTALVGNAMKEHKQSYSETRTSLENQIKNLQLENGELKSRISQMEDEWKKLTSEYKMKSLRAKKFLQSQVSIASQKLLFADFKLKEFFLTIEKLLRGLYKCTYEGELESIRRKCNEEGGVQAATSILGVSPSEMTKVLAAGTLPNLSEWLDTCLKLAYRDKFADELAAYVTSLFQAALNKNSKKGSGPVFQ